MPRSKPSLWVMIGAMVVGGLSYVATGFPCAEPGYFGEGAFLGALLLFGVPAYLITEALDRLSTRRRQ